MVSDEQSGLPADPGEIVLTECEDDISFECTVCDEKVNLVPEDFDNDGDPISCGSCGTRYLCGETEGVRWVEFIGLRLSDD